jgi:UDP-2-acetamido-2-deoxy-ribo-hexuluronate aminotransferase
MEFVDLKTQYSRYKDEIDKAIQRVLNHGGYIMGPEIKELESTLAAYVGVKHCISAASGTHTLEIALRALNIGPGDEVITVSFTWISSAEIIGLVGATPVFVDIDPITFNIDPVKLEKAITARTKAIIPVDIFGQMANYAAINAMAAKHGIHVIEDGAQSFGAVQNGTKSCAASLIGSTSFFPAKVFGCYGDGGALFTNDDQLAETMRALRVHGAEVRHHHTHLGMNARLDTLQAAILLAKFPHFEDELRARYRIGERYTELLKDVCTTPDVMPGNTHVYHQYTIRIPDRDALARELKAKGIPTAVYYPKCVHLQPVFASLGYAVGSFPEAEAAASEVLSLPMHPWLTDKEQDFIVDSIKEALVGV